MDLFITVMVLTGLYALALYVNKLIEKIDDQD